MLIWISSERGNEKKQPLNVSGSVIIALFAQRSASGSFSLPDIILYDTNCGLKMSLTAVSVYSFVLSLVRFTAPAINLDVCFTFTFQPSVRPWEEWIKSKCLTRPNGSWRWNCQEPFLPLPHSAALQDADKQLQACRELICFAERSNNFCLSSQSLSHRDQLLGSQNLFVVLVTPRLHYHTITNA